MQGCITANLKATVQPCRIDCYSSVWLNCNRKDMYVSGSLAVQKRRLKR